MQEPHAQRVQWTRRQRQVLDLLARGSTNGQIAEQLEISLAGAKWHVSEILSKLGVTSREEAAAYWLREQGTATRLRRLARALIAPIVLRWTGAAALGIGTTAVIVSVAAGFARSGSTAGPAEPSPTLNPQAVYSDAQAGAVARQIAQTLVFDPFEMRAAPDPMAVRNFQQQAGNDPAALSAYMQTWRRIDASDLELVSSTFSPAATTVTSNVIGTNDVLERPANAWTFAFALRPPEQPDADHEPDVVLSFADGSGAPLSGGRVGRNLGPGEAGAFPVASYHYGGVTFTLFVRRTEEYAAARPAGLSMYPAGTWCTMDTDSRSPGTGGGACGLSDPGPMAVSPHPTHGFAHVSGLVADNVARVRAVSADGREVVVEPTAKPDGHGFPWRGFVAAVPSSSWFVTVQALDVTGAVVDSKTFAGRP